MGALLPKSPANHTMKEKKANITVHGVPAKMQVHEWFDRLAARTSLKRTGSGDGEGIHFTESFQQA